MEKLAAYVVREGGLSTDDAVGWIVRLTSTLEPIHGLGVSHGRVSAKAIQIADPRCTSPGFLLDAGNLKDDPAYFSLERLIDGRRTPADDTWAAGVTLYRMLTGELPYVGATVDEMRALISGPPPSPLAVFDVGDDEIQGILDALFTSNRDRRVMRLDALRTRLLSVRPRLASLPQLQYGTPGDDDDDEEVLTTNVIDLTGEFGDVVREAQRRIAGASALPDGSNAPRSVRPPPPPSVPPRAAVPATAIAEVDMSAGLALIESAIPQAATAARAAATQAVAPPAAPAPAAGSQNAGSASPAEDHQASEPAQPPHDVVVPPPSAPEPAAAAEPSSNHPSSSQAHVASVRPPPTTRSHTKTYLLGALCVLAGAGAAFVVMGGGFTTTPSQTAAVIEPTAASGANPAGSTARTSDAAAAISNAPPPPNASAEHDPAKAGARVFDTDAGSCVAALFVEDTFQDGPPKLPNLCTTASPIRGSKDLRGAIVRAGGGTKGVTSGMRELSTMGWYRMAAFAVVRGHCCADAPPFATPTSLPCNLDHRLERLSRTVNGGGDLEAEAALEQVTKSFNCLGRGGGADFFGQQGLPSGGELTTFHKLFARVRRRAMSNNPK